MQFLSLYGDEQLLILAECCQQEGEGEQEEVEEVSSDRGVHDGLERSQ